MPADAKTLVSRLFDEVFNEGRYEVADQIVAESYIEHAVAPFGRDEPGEVHGPTHAREVVEWLRAQFSDMRMTIEDVVADGDKVVVRVRSEGTNDGKLGGFAPPTGKRFSAEQTHWYRIADGKLCEHWAVRDDLSTMLQLGAVQPAGPPPSSS
jgi:predicted ester cyclase